MSDTIHIHLHYNILHEKITFSNNDIQKKETFITSQISIITDKNEVRKILQNPNNIINKYGEFIDYDTKLFYDYAMNDYVNYRHCKNFTECNEYDYHMDSIYYIKCELVKDISNELNTFTNYKLNLDIE